MYLSTILCHVRMLFFFCKIYILHKYTIHRQSGAAIHMYIMSDIEQSLKQAYNTVFQLEVYVMQIYWITNFIFRVNMQVKGMQPRKLEKIKTSNDIQDIFKFFMSRTYIYSLVNIIGYAKKMDRKHYKVTD